MRAARCPVRSLRWRLAGHVTNEDLVDGLHALGLGIGDTVMVHSSLSRLGHVEGGSRAVVQALLDAVGSEGLVVMPAYPINRSTLEYLGTDPLFDPDESPSRMGKITEELRLWSGAARSIHPTHSISAVGQDAGELVRDHYRAVTPFSLETPFGKLLERDARVLCLGVGLEPTVFYHVFEDVTGGYPLSVYRPEPERTRILVDGTELTIEIPVHDPELARFRIDHDDQVRDRITKKLSEYGLLRRGKVGHGDSYLIRARDLMSGLERMLSEKIVIYNTNRMEREGWELPAELRTGLERKTP